MLFLNKRGRSSWGSPSNSLGISHSCQNSSTSLLQMIRTPKGPLFYGRNRSVVEHVSRFIHTMGPYTGYRKLCLREFAKSLVDIAYTWYATLRPGSIKTWDEMMEKFCAKYYPGKDKVTSRAFKWWSKGLWRILSVSSKDLRTFPWIVMEITRKKSSWSCAYPTCSLITDLILKIYA